MTAVVWTSVAVADLEAVRDYIARDTPVYADALVARILAAVTSLESFPRSGRLVPEARRVTIRELLVSSYRLIYRVRPGRVEILAIIHGARDLRRSSSKRWRP